MMDKNGISAVLEMYRGTCPCGVWLMIPKEYDMLNPWVCLCGRKYWHQSDGSLYQDGSGKYRHKEAFCRMWYQCETCSARERFWNSRDGVTPFVVSGACKTCGGDMKHVDWQVDRHAPDYIPVPDDGVFVDLPESLKRTIALARVEGAKGTKWEVPHERLQETIAGIVLSFQDGEPWFFRWRR